MPTWSQSVVKASKNVESVLALRFRKALHIIAGILCFSDILKKAFLEEVILCKLIGNKLFPYFKSTISADAILLSHQLGKIFQLIPKDWFKQSKF